jgi:hypothetical protein
LKPWPRKWLAAPLKSESGFFPFRTKVFIRAHHETKRAAKPRFVAIVDLHQFERDPLLSGTYAP